MNSLNRKRRPKVSVIGAGYVGLPTAATLSHFGCEVVCAESNPVRFSKLERGEMPIFERGLDALVQEGIELGTLRFSRSASEAVKGAEFVFLCVPTPMGADGSADLDTLKAAAREIASNLRPAAIVVNKSTVPVGTALLVKQVTGRDDVIVVANPEFLREGTAVADSLHPDRIVVGAEDHRAAARVGQLFANTRAPLIVTDTATAETIKYASNAFLAIKISFVNALAGLCDSLGADVRDVVLGLGYDKRIGFDALRPGPGWGGSCLPKDTAALAHIAETAGYDFALLREAIMANNIQMKRIVDKITIAVGGSLQGHTIGVWGLTFKAGTDDLRSSPAVEIVHQLISGGARVTAYDPTVATDRIPDDLKDVIICSDALDAIRDVEAIALLTEWNEFRGLDFIKVHELMAGSAIVDARNLLDPVALRRLGFAYTGIGRP